MSVVTELKELGKEFKVLYVEDDDALRDSIETYLKKIFGYVETAENGLIGLKKYEKGVFDIVISDILMPKMNGLEMIKKIKDSDAEQEVIIISAYSEPKYFEEAIQTGVNGYIIKPVSYEQFNTTLIKSVKKLTKFKENDLYREHLEELVEERTKRLSEAEAKKTENFKQTLFALVEMIEDRDTYTAGHSQRVAKYSKMIASKMGYSSDECELIYQAGILHDIGKVATPDTVLLKPGGLNELEYRLIKEHVTVGYDLLNKISMYKELSDIMRHHHERYDGKGYPEGLCGDEIPLHAHIMIVADAFDAMTTSRIYKSRMSVREAIDEIKELSGKQFEPDVAKISIEVFQSMENIGHTSQLPVTQLEQERFSYFYRDQLTSTYNREYLDLMLSHNKFDNSYVYAYVIYLHNFSEYNKKHSWSDGDQLLYDLAEELKKIAKKSLVFRIYGDDFLILSKSKIDLNIENINTLSFLKRNDLHCSIKTIEINSDEIYDLRTLEGYINDHE